MEVIALKDAPEGRVMKRALQNTGLIAASILVGLVALEVLVRVFIPQQLILVRPDIWMPDSVTGFRRCPEIDTRVNWGERPVRLVTDADGFRIDDPSQREARESALSILAIGDSFLEALQVENHQTLLRVIEDSLEARLHLSVRVDNASAGGWDPNHYRLEAKRALQERRYDLGIVFLYAANDIVEKSVVSIEPRAPTVRHAFRVPRRMSRREFVDGVLYPVNDLLEKSSHFFVLAKKQSRDVLARMGLTAYYFPDVYDRRQAKADMWDVTTAISKDIASEFASCETPVFFVLLPSSYQVYERRLADYVQWFRIDPSTVDVDQPNRAISARFSEAGLVLADPLAHLRAASREKEPLYGSVDTHLSVRGHREVAAFLLPVIDGFLTAAERGGERSRPRRRRRDKGFARSRTVVQNPVDSRGGLA